MYGLAWKHVSKLVVQGRGELTAFSVFGNKMLQTAEINDWVQSPSQHSVLYILS